MALMGRTIIIENIRCIDSLFLPPSSLTMIIQISSLTHIIYPYILIGPVNTPLLDRAFKSESFKYNVESDGKEKKILDKRMTSLRCAYLMSIAIANKLDETWISKQPILWLLYATQYFPTLFRLLAKFYELYIILNIIIV